MRRILLCGVVLLALSGCNPRGFVRGFVGAGPREDETKKEQEARKEGEAVGEAAGAATRKVVENAFPPAKIIFGLLMTLFAGAAGNEVRKRVEGEGGS